MTPKHWLVFSFVLLGSEVVQAGPPVCDPGDPRLCSAPLQRGDPAPYAGQLLTPDLAIQLGQKADSCDTRLRLEVDLAKKLDAVDLTLERQLRRNDADAASDREAVLLRQLEEAEAVPFWQTPLFVSSVSFVAGVALMALAVWSAGQLR